MCAHLSSLLAGSRSAVSSGVLFQALHGDVVYSSLFCPSSGGNIVVFSLIGKHSKSIVVFLLFMVDCSDSIPSRSPSN